MRRITSDLRLVDEGALRDRIASSLAAPANGKGSLRLNVELQSLHFDGNGHWVAVVAHRARAGAGSLDAARLAEKLAAVEEVIYREHGINLLFAPVVAVSRVRRPRKG